MPKHNPALYAVGFFLLGVFVFSLWPKFLIATAAAGIAAAACWFLDKRLLGALSIFIILGAGYHFLYDFYRQGPELILEQKITLTGIIRKSEQRLNSQKLVIENVQITAQRYPVFNYGDRLEIKGVIKPVPEEFKNYFTKEGIEGLMSFSEIKLVSRGNGSVIKFALFKIKNFFEQSYKKVLPFEQAAFLAGLTLGSTAEFSDDFDEKLRLTGTSHLVALSGYNISIIIRYIGGALGLWWLTKKVKLPLTILFVVAFVIMTGAEASVVRAAIMALILLLADNIGRRAHIPNAIAAAALIMVLINPKILAFDIGFQLSFMALIGIIYLEPWLRRKLKAKSDPGFFGWRSHFWTTTSAQLAVLPLIIYYFGFVSPVSLLTNVLLLEVIPVTMGLGFFIGFAATANYWLSWLIALPAQAFLKYELSVIDIFSKITNILI